MDFLDTDTSVRSGPKADEAVTALYAAHAVGLIRLAFVMLGNRGAAEDVVQDAFLGLYRNWDRLNDPAKAIPYLRSSVRPSAAMARDMADFTVPVLMPITL